MEEKKKFHIVEHSNDVKWLTGFEYCVEIPATFSKHAQIKRWCEDNCQDVVCFYTIKYPSSSRVDQRIYFFLEEDAVAYKLKWS